MKTTIALAVASFLLNCLVGCSHTQGITQPVTAAASGHVTKIQSDLSDIDGKTVSIQQLLHP